MPRDQRLTAQAYSRALAGLRTAFKAEYEIQLTHAMLIKAMDRGAASREALRCLRSNHRGWFDLRRESIYQELANAASEDEIEAALESIRSANPQAGNEIGPVGPVTGHSADNPYFADHSKPTMRDYLDRYLELKGLEFKHEPGLMDELMDPDMRSDLEAEMIEKLMTAIGMCHHLGTTMEELLERHLEMVDA